MNLILPNYFTLYIIYKKLPATPRKKQNNPLGGCNPQVENHCFKQITEKFSCNEFSSLFSSELHRLPSNCTIGCFSKLPLIFPMDY